MNMNKFKYKDVETAQIRTCNKHFFLKRNKKQIFKEKFKRS